MAKRPKKTKPAKTLQPVKAWGCVHKGKLCLWAESNREFVQAYTEDIHECKIIPVLIVPIQKKTTNKKARRA